MQSLKYSSHLSVEYLIQIKESEVLLHDVIIVNLAWVLVINFSFSKNLPHMPVS